MMVDLLFYEEPLPAYALLLYFVLRELPGPTDGPMSDPWTTATLARLARISRASVFRGLNILEERKLIERKRVGREANQYRILRATERRAAIATAPH